MPRVLVVADSSWVVDDVHGALSEPGFDLTDHDDPHSAAARAAELDADAVVIDLQVRSMGGMAITRSLREEASRDGGSLPGTVMLLDRRADVFLARRAGAHAWVQKPVNAAQLREAVAAAIAAAGREMAEDETEPEDG